MPIPYSEEPNVTAVTTPTVSWAVSATHNFINQAITDTTSLVTAGLSTPGSENYVEDFANAIIEVKTSWITLHMAWLLVSIVAFAAKTFA